MKISAKARYGLRILLDIAANGTVERPRPIKEICEAEALSEKFTSRLVIPLREAGMIVSVRGKQGGFRLAKPPNEISLLEIVETLQGPIALVDCVSDGTACTRSGKCPTRRVWSDINATLRKTFEKITLEGLLKA